jgi:hypothetical protein
LACCHDELLDVVGRSGLVIVEKQAPGLFVRLDPFALQRRWQIEHYYVRLVMSEDGGKIVPADGVRPVVDKVDGTVGFDGLVLDGWMATTVLDLPQ